jgi:hypothetical protein
VASQFSALRAAVSLTSLSIIGHLPIAVSPVGVVGEIVAQFWDYADWCSHLEAAGLGVCGLVLGSVGDETNLTAHLEQVTG